MHDDHVVDELSAWLDGDLPPGRAQVVEDHLRACEACAAVAADLTRVRDLARSLPDWGPEGDLWPLIRSELRRPSGGADEVGVIDLTRRLRPRVPRPAGSGALRRAAIIAAVALFSGAAAWTARPLLEAERAASAGAAVEAPRAALRSVADVDPALGAYEDEVRTLRRALDEHRDRLSPTTVRVLERNLALIDRAIEESLAALTDDPGSAFLHGHLREALERKVRLLREAAAAAENAA
ncbi:MAG: hypothetical protein D6701_12150 [Gemmatimonadetes bacterium]|nr:MAG: hypothetical protein D6701_12150 [Gemmatimonadota bacterium]